MHFCCLMLEFLVAPFSFFYFVSHDTVFLPFEMYSTKQSNLEHLNIFPIVINVTPLSKTS